MPLRAFKLATIPDKSLGTLAHFSSICQGNFSLPPSPQFNVVYRDEDCHCSFPTLSGGRGFLIPVMPLVTVSKIAYQRMFQLSDPGVPRTFVEDCRYSFQFDPGMHGISERVLVNPLVLRG